MAEKQRFLKIDYIEHNMVRNQANMSLMWKQMVSSMFL